MLPRHVLALNNLPVITFVDNGAKLSDIQSSKILSQFLKHQRANKIKVWDQNSSHFCFVTNKAGVKRKIKIFFPRKLVYRTKQIANTKKKHARYDIVGDEIGEGSYGHVYDVLATLSHLRSGGMRLSTNHEYVIKLQNHVRPNINGQICDPKMAIDEAEIGKKTPHLGMKKITLRKDKKGRIIESYTVSLKLKEKKLGDVIDADYHENPTLPTKQRIRLSINILRAYIEQFLDYHIVHRDIKCSNAMADQDDLINFFDVGFAKLFADIDDSYAGTPSYSAPECFTYNALQNDKSDFYSLGVMLFQLWRAEDQSTGRLDDLQKAALNQLPRIFTKLGIKIADINDFKQTIHDLINGLLANEQDARSHPSQILEGFEDIRLRYKLTQELEGISQENAAALIEANKIARATNSALHDIKTKKSPNPLGVLQSVIDCALEKLQAIKLNVYLDVVDKNKLIRDITDEFLDVINAHVFKQVDANKQFLDINGIKTKAQQIISDFTFNQKVMHKLSERLTLNIQLLNFKTPDYDKTELSLTLEEMQEMLEVVLYKVQLCEITFDDLDKFNQKFEKKRLLVQEKLDALEVEVDKHPQEFATMQTYKRIMRKLQLKTDDYQVTHLRNGISNVIAGYIKDASIQISKKTELEKYSQDIEKIVDTIDTRDNLQTNLIEKINSMQVGFFSHALQHDLRKVVMEANRNRFVV